jgi:hypothetical protein
MRTLRPFLVLSILAGLLLAGCSDDPATPTEPATVEVAKAGGQTLPIDQDFLEALWADFDDQTWKEYPISFNRSGDCVVFHPDDWPEGWDVVVTVPGDARFVGEPPVSMTILIPANETNVIDDASLFMIDNQPRSTAITVAVYPHSWYDENDYLPHHSTYRLLNDGMSSEVEFDRFHFGPTPMPPWSTPPCVLFLTADERPERRQKYVADRQIPGDD